MTVTCFHQTGPEQTICSHSFKAGHRVDHISLSLIRSRPDKIDAKLLQSLCTREYFGLLIGNLSEIFGKPVLSQGGFDQALPHRSPPMSRSLHFSCTMRPHRSSREGHIRLHSPRSPLLSTNLVTLIVHLSFFAKKKWGIAPIAMPHVGIENLTSELIDERLFDGRLRSSSGRCIPGHQARCCCRSLPIRPDRSDGSDRRTRTRRATPRHLI